jgi:threonine synthase
LICTKKQKRENDVAKLMAEFERSGALKVGDDVMKLAKTSFSSYAVDDKTTKKTIGEIFASTSETLDPHSAVGVYAAQQFMKNVNYQNEVIVTLATAHPAKFAESLQGCNVPEVKLPNFLSDLHQRPESFEVIANNLADVKKFISAKV